MSYHQPNYHNQTLCCPPGIKGSRGPQGPQGYQGHQGLRGFQGFQGTQGSEGSSCPFELIIIHEDTTIVDWNYRTIYLVDTMNKEITITINPIGPNDNILNFRLLYKKGFDCILSCQNPISTTRLTQYASEKSILYYNNTWFIVNDYETNSFYPTQQQGTKLIGTGYNPAGEVRQGRSVALSADGNTLAVGGHRDDNNLGATWIFIRDSNGIWTQQGNKLVGTGYTGPFVRQGRSVALSADGNTLAVGALRDNNDLGATWIFIRDNNGIWSQQGNKLIGTGSSLVASQGYYVDLSADGNTLAIGGPEDNVQRGATWIFTRNNSGVWSQQGNKLVGSGFVGRGYQGSAISLSADGNTLAVGAQFDNSNIGATWIFIRDNFGIWKQQGNKLVGNGYIGTIIYQGYSVSLSADGNVLGMGAINDNNGIGATWIFTRNNDVWSQQGNKLVGIGYTGTSINQGNSVDLTSDGNTLAIGGPGDNSGTGATWIFTRNNGVWNQQGTKFVGSGSIGDANQGTSISLSSDGNTLAVGGFLDDNFVGGTWIFV